MSSTKSILATLTGILTRMLAKEDPKNPSRPRRPDAVLRPEGRPDGRSAGRSARDEDEATAGRMRGSETVQVDPERVRDVAVGYSPSRNDAPDSGEVIWTWVPYAERDGRGKDRPVLVVARQSRDRVYAVKLTSRAHPASDAYVAVGAGGWDPQRRPSWADIDQLYSVSHAGLRREGATLDGARFARVADALRARFGWR